MQLQVSQILVHIPGLFRGVIDFFKAFGVFTRYFVTQPTSWAGLSGILFWKHLNFCGLETFLVQGLKSLSD